MLTAFIARITPPCRDVARLSSESMDRTLPWSTRIKLRFHYWICEACAQYRRQLLMVREAMRRQSGPEAGTTSQSAPRLSDKARAQLTQALKARQD
jgi:hypothetical protein